MKEKDPIQSKTIMPEILHDMKQDAIYRSGLGICKKCADFQIMLEIEYEEMRPTKIWKTFGYLIQRICLYCGACEEVILIPIKK
jgi:hypothetical protein